MTSRRDQLVAARRPLKTRGRPQAAALARWFARAGVGANTISVASVAVAAAAAASLIAAPDAAGATRVVLLIAAAAFIQLRLLANLMDGMVAVEEGHRTPTGDLYNEIPDRVADVLILVAAGYATTWFSNGEALGWAAAVGALLTAYVRVLGGSLGLTQHFCGPMAKPQRMAVLTVACLASTIETAFGFSGRALTTALLVVAAGSLVTFVRRTRLLALELRGR